MVRTSPSPPVRLLKKCGTTRSPSPSVLRGERGENAKLSNFKRQYSTRFVGANPANRRDLSGRLFWISFIAGGYAFYIGVDAAILFLIYSALHLWLPKNLSRL